MERVVRALHEISEAVLDGCYGHLTAGRMVVEEAATGSADAEEYAATPYRIIRRVLNRLPRESLEGSFIDYGCGRGRMLLMAASRPFRRAIGLELSERLYNEALENIARSRTPRQCGIEVLQTDAARFPLPDDVSTVYFYNPFRGGTMDGVIDRITESLCRRPRALWIAGCNPQTLEEAASRKLRLSLEVQGRTVYPAVRWVVYRAAL